MTLHHGPEIVGNNQNGNSTENLSLLATRASFPLIPYPNGYSEMQSYFPGENGSLRSLDGHYFEEKRNLALAQYLIDVGNPALWMENSLAETQIFEEDVPEMEGVTFTNRHPRFGSVIDAALDGMTDVVIRTGGSADNPEDRKIYQTYETFIMKKNLEVAAKQGLFNHNEQNMFILPYDGARLLGPMVEKRASDQASIMTLNAKRIQGENEEGGETMYIALDGIEITMRDEIDSPRRETNEQELSQITRAIFVDDCSASAATPMAMLYALPKGITDFVLITDVMNIDAFKQLQEVGRSRGIKVTAISGGPNTKVNNQFYLLRNSSKAKYANLEVPTQFVGDMGAFGQSTDGTEQWGADRLATKVIRLEHVMHTAA